MTARDDDYYRHSVNTYCKVTGLKLDAGQVKCAAGVLRMRDQVRIDNNRTLMFYDEMCDVMFAFFAGLYYQREIVAPVRAVVSPMKVRRINPVTRVTYKRKDV